MKEPAKDRKTVMVLDDDEPLLRAVGRILRMHGYDVFEATSAREAFTILDEGSNSVDAVLCDLVLPGLHGREAASIIVTRRPDVRVLFTSGFAGLSSGRQALIDAGEPFLQKPFDAPELLLAIEALLAA